jgi:hypothetical protein
VVSNTLCNDKEKKDTQDPSTQYLVSITHGKQTPAARLGPIKSLEPDLKSRSFYIGQIKKRREHLAMLKNHAPSVA